MSHPKGQNDPQKEYPDTIQEVKIGDIKVGERVRRDMGDLEALAEAIRKQELLPLIDITPELELVCGERTLRACRDILGWKTIPVRMFPFKSVFRGQIAPNLLQQSYTVSERVEIVEAICTFRHGGDRRSDQVRNCEDEMLTIDEAAKRVGLGGKDDFYRAKGVVERGVPELVTAMDSGEVSISAAATLADAPADEQKLVLAQGNDEQRWVKRGVKKRLMQVRKDKKRAADLNMDVRVPSREEDIRLYHCPFQHLEATAGIEPSSVHLICTDIPYGDDFVPQIEELAALAARVLVPGGVFVSHLGHFRFDEKLAILSRHLKWGWLSSSVWDGRVNPVPRLKLFSRQIPIAIYTNGSSEPQTNWCDLFTFKPEKDWHEWQRPLGEVEALVGYYSRPGDLVVDPCAGGFTTALACHRLGRRCISCDIDKAAVVRGSERLAQARSGPSAA